MGHAEYAAGGVDFNSEITTDMKYIAEKYGKSHVPGFFITVGNHIPPNTPVENALYYNEVYDELS